MIGSSLIQPRASPSSYYDDVDGLVYFVDLDGGVHPQLCRNCLSRRLVNWARWLRDGCGTCDGCGFYANGDGKSAAGLARLSDGR